MKKMPAILLLLLAACGEGSEADAMKDRAAAAANWALVFKLDGADVKIPLTIMNVSLWKDEDYASRNPTVFHLEGEGVDLIGEIPPANNVGYGENWDKLKGVALSIKPSGEYDREVVESKITLPGKPAVKVLNGTLTPESFSGKWGGSKGDKTIKGRFSILLADGRRLEGTFAANAVTWG